MYRAPAATLSFGSIPSQLREHCERSSVSHPVHTSETALQQQPSRSSTVLRNTDAGYLNSLAGQAIQLPKIYTEAPSRYGLKTPPADDMNSAPSYLPQNTSWARNGDNGTYVPSLGAASQSYAYNTQQPQQPQVAGYPVQRSAAVPYVQHTQAARTSVLAPESITQAKSSILPGLQIPPEITKGGGNLGEFAAQITCLFWFESIQTLRRAETWTSAASPVKPIVLDALPTQSFRKWVVTILTTTQVTPNVVLLALLFIYRLKTLNSTVKGKPGSEYRLLTVALMLGNKFLDDNTYTNKTWADVSGISVGEIHVMEVEFLSNMRYSLLASEEQWKEWQIKLRKFWEYFRRASHAALALPSPDATKPSSALPSPTTMANSPQTLLPYSVSSTPYNNQMWPATNTLPSMPALIPELNLQGGARKRHYDEPASEPAAKRLSRSVTPQVALPQPTMSVPQQAMANGVPRLPVPGLSVNTAQSVMRSTAPAPYTQIPQNLTLPPPIAPGMRAMATVYPPATPSVQLPFPTEPLSLTPTHVRHGSGYPSTSGYTTPSRRRSPRSVQEAIAAASASMNSSPISATASGYPMSASHNLNSPSFFLQQRSSPYKPVRPPHTLLVAPPSTSMHAYAMINGGPMQMSYQPLGRRGDLRTGVVPEYAAFPAEYQQQNGWMLPQPYGNYQN